MVWNDQKFKFWLGLFVSLGPNTIDHYFFLSPGIVMTMMLRILFGAETVSSKLTTACFHVDSWFTGADFPHAALACIRSAVRRRKLVFYLYFVLLNVCVRMWGSMFLLFVTSDKILFFYGQHHYKVWERTWVHSWWSLWCVQSLPQVTSLDSATF